MTAVQTKASELFLSIGEPYAAGLFEDETKGYFYRHCAGCASWFRHLAPVPYHKGDRVYPTGAKNSLAAPTAAVIPHYAQGWRADMNALAAKSPEAAELLRPIAEVCRWPGGWLHGAPHYSRIIREGLSSYRERVLLRPEGEEFREGLLLLLDGMENYVSRCADYLASVGADEALVSALRHVPFAPARTYYEGLAAWNMIYYLDGCDNLGCLDRGLAHLYRGEDYTDVIAQMFRNVDDTGMWSCTVGPDDNGITRQALYAVRGRRRPLLELRVTEDMPDELWRIAAENFSMQCTHPSFYNDRGIHDMLKTHFPDIPDAELAGFCGCGCTETNLEGLTRAGGTDDNLNLLKIFETYLHAHLADSPTFDDFFEGLCAETEAQTHAMLGRIADRYLHMSRYVPHPIRTLFFDDCIERGLDYNAGGARYTWTMNADSGIINVIDCLSAVRKLVYEERRYTPGEFLSLLSAEDESFYAVLKACPCFGTDDARTDALGSAYAERVYSAYRTYPKVGFIDAFLVTEHQFIRHEYAGREVGPTPDGRHRGEASCDSVAALRGKAVLGPTAMLRSAARLPQQLADGISVLNLTLQKKTAENPVLLKALISGYFALGGIQVQITVTSREELDDAMAHPERHGDLIVRVGGYSEYFSRLSPTLRKAIYDRDIHCL